MTSALILWSHALAALLFGALAFAEFKRGERGLPRIAFVTALAMTAMWALAVAGIDAGDVIARIAESLRNLAWLGFMFALVRRGPAVRLNSAIVAMYGIVGSLAVLCASLAVAELATKAPDAAQAIVDVRVALRMMGAVGALVLVRHFYTVVAPPSRGGIRLLVVALASMWSVDLAVSAVGYGGSGGPAPFVALRGCAMAFVALLFAIAAHRSGEWKLVLSRTATYRSIAAAALLLYFCLVLVATGLAGIVGGDNVRLIQASLVFGSAAALIALVSTPWLRAWAKVKVAKHLFDHRYDYRAEWQRFTETLGVQGDGSAPLDARIVKAVADLTDSPAGLLLVVDGAGLGAGAGWNWDRANLPLAGGDEALAAHLQSTGRIIELEPVRADPDHADAAACVPQWIADRADAWAIVPLIHVDALVGAILLARPPVPRQLDWEDFDLLRVAGRQAASCLAEDRAHAALADAQRFDEFNRRFAFIMHDIKNLVSQISLVARNAERHADNPDFRADMIATLKDSATRMNALLARLSHHHVGRPDASVATDIAPVVERVAAARRAQHPIAIGGTGAVALADPARLEQVLGHLVQNAIEASPPAEPVTLMVGDHAGQVWIEVIDRGCGMSPAFLRDELFRPFVSSKPGGFGIGAFEARQLTHAMGGTITVTSREREGTCFRILLPAAGAIALEVAA